MAEKLDIPGLLKTAVEKKQSGDDKLSLHESIAMGVDHAEAAAVRRQNGSEPMWTFWLRQETWTPCQAAMLVCREEPHGISEHEKHEQLQNRDVRSRPAWANLYHNVISAVKAGTLRPVFRDGCLVPDEFLRWAQNKGVDIPEPLRPLLEPKQNAEARADDDGDLSTKERKSLHVIIAALASFAKIDLAKPSAAATTIQRQADLLSASISQRCIEGHINEVVKTVGNMVD